MVFKSWCRQTQTDTHTPTSASCMHVFVLDVWHPSQTDALSWKLYYLPPASQLVTRNVASANGLCICCAHKVTAVPSTECMWFSIVGHMLSKHGRIVPFYLPPHFGPGQRSRSVNNGIFFGLNSILKAKRPISSKKWPKWCSTIRHVEGWTVKVEVKDAKMSKLLLYHNSAIYHVMYVKYRPQ